MRWDGGRTRRQRWPTHANQRYVLGSSRRDGERGASWGLQRSQLAAILASMSSHRRSAFAAALVVTAGGAAAIALGLSRRLLPEVVLTLGITLVVASLEARDRQHDMSSGVILAGLASALVLSEHLASDYAQPLTFAGIAVGLFVVALPRTPAMGAAMALLSVAVAEAALTYLPPRLSADGFWRAFEDGWGFGALFVVWGLVRAGRALTRRRRWEEGNSRSTG